MLTGDELYDDEITSGLDERPCSICGSSETREVCQGDQCITVCAECGSDEP